MALGQETKVEIPMDPTIYCILKFAQSFASLAVVGRWEKHAWNSSYIQNFLKLGCLWIKNVVVWFFKKINSHLSKKQHISVIFGKVTLI